MMWQDADYWENRWQKERRESLYEQRQKGIDRVEWWNQRAPGFADRYSKKGGEKQDMVFRTLEQSGFINPDMEMLDIGCGPGNYAIPLASRFKRVVALDPSSKMLSILMERAASSGIDNIEPVCMSWEDVDLSKLKWQGRFGLVAAIKTPGITNAQALKKMVDASCMACFYNGFIKREDYAQNDIWRILYNEEKPPLSADPFYVFHLLHAWGFLPTIELREHLDQKMISTKEAQEQLMMIMKPYKDIKGTMAEQIHGYVQQNTIDGKFNRKRYMVEGNIMVKVYRR